MIAAAKAKLGRTKQVIDDQDIVVDAAVDDLRLAIGGTDLWLRFAGWLTS